MLSLPKKMTALTETYNPTSMSLCRARVSIIGESEPTNEQSGNDCVLLLILVQIVFDRKKKKEKGELLGRKTRRCFSSFQNSFQRRQTIATRFF